jgi:hypothetical protein
VTVGNSNALETAWKPLDYTKPLKGISVELSAGASLTYEVQYGVRKRYPSSEAETAILALADQTLTAKTVSAGLVANLPFQLIRLKITAFVSGTATLHVSETRA